MEPELYERVFLALDGLSLEQCVELVARVGKRVCGVKIHNIWDLHGPAVVQRLLNAGAEKVWADLKLKDIPNTVKLRAEAVLASGASILTVHASGGVEMMEAAMSCSKLVNHFEIFAVTILTSLDEEDTHLLHGQPAKAAVLYQARLAKLAGVQGVVCSPQEVGVLAKRPELRGLKLVVPGVRSAGKDADDQARVATPAAAITAGAHHIVIGRQVTKASDPAAALDEVMREIAAALAAKEGGVS